MASALADSDVRPHDRFFFSDGSLYLLVENSLYCVHKFIFEIYANMSPVRELETSLNEPYVLGDVTKSDFDRLLANFYPQTIGVEEMETTQDWISVLALASKWGFNGLRSKAISKIKQTLQSPIDMVVLGRQYDIPNVLLPGYAILSQSIVPLSYEEGLRLGMEDVVNIYRIRHELYGSGITPVPLEVAFAKVKAGLGVERLRQLEELDSQQASTRTEVAAALTPEAPKEETAAEPATESPGPRAEPFTEFKQEEPVPADAPANTLATEAPKEEKKVVKVGRRISARVSEFFKTRHKEFAISPANVDEHPPKIDEPAPMIDEPAPIIDEPAPMIDEPAPVQPIYVVPAVA